MRLRNVTVNPEASWQSLLDSGSTHAVLHSAAFANQADAVVVKQWLESHGARLVEQFPDGDTLFELPSGSGIRDPRSN